MQSPGPRRIALVCLASGLVAAAVAVGSAPVAATPRHAAALAKGKITVSNLDGVSVAPHSSTAWGYGSQSTASKTTSFALRRSGGHWSKKPLKAPKGAAFYAVAAGSAHSAWIMGDTLKGVNAETLVEHSSGAGFKPIKTKLGRGQLLAASASSPSNVWAVGDGRTTAGPYIVHGNGKSWKALPETSLVGDSFTAVSASSPNNVWFLGSGTAGPIVGIWNGHKLTVKPNPEPTGAVASSVVTTSAHNTWAIGAKPVAANDGRTRPFTEHWNGHSWKTVKISIPGYSATQVLGTGAGSRLYLAATVYNKSGLFESAVIYRYAGGKWKKSPSASPGRDTDIASISVSSKGGAAVGAWSVHGQCGVKHPTPYMPFAENLTGTSWHQASVAKFRRGSAAMWRATTRPDVAGC